jgi:hypothetical protein
LYSAVVGNGLRLMFLGVKSDKSEALARWTVVPHNFDRHGVVFGECLLEVVVGGALGDPGNKGGVPLAALWWARRADENAAPIDGDVTLVVDGLLKSFDGLEFDKTKAKGLSLLPADRSSDDANVRKFPKLGEPTRKSLAICFVVDVVDKHRFPARFGHSKWPGTTAMPGRYL